MPYLASFFPDEWEISHVDEYCERIEFSQNYDIVGLTFHTPSAPHAYEIADAFRAKGSYVIMGGPHATIAPDDAQRHADTIFVGEAEYTLPHFISDFLHGDAKPRYTCEIPPSLDDVPFSRKAMLHRHDHAGGIMFATRGCPNNCSFCTLAKMYGQSFRKRPIEQVAREFGSFPGKVVIFWDDNLAADLEYAKELFKAIKPYRKWWSCQVSTNAGSDDDFLELAKQSGCKQLFMGFESISAQSLAGAGKSFNKPDDFAHIIHNVHAHQISMQAGIVFGFDEDEPDVFNQTSDFLETNGIQNATFHILTPYPGTPLFDRLNKEGRILTYDWSKYNAREDVVFIPKNMSAEELLEGFRRVNRRFYSLTGVARRLRRSSVGLYWTLPLNIAYGWLYAHRG